MYPTTASTNSTAYPLSTQSIYQRNPLRFSLPPNQNYQIASIRRQSQLSDSLPQLSQPMHTFGKVGSSLNQLANSDVSQSPYGYYQEAPTLRVGDFLDPTKNLQYFPLNTYEQSVRKTSFQEQNELGGGGRY